MLILWVLSCLAQLSEADQVFGGYRGFGDHRAYGAYGKRFGPICLLGFTLETSKMTFKHAEGGRWALTTTQRLEDKPPLKICVVSFALDKDNSCGSDPRPIHLTADFCNDVLRVYKETCNNYRNSPQKYRIYAKTKLSTTITLDTRNNPFCFLINSEDFKGETCDTTALRCTNATGSLRYNISPEGLTNSLLNNQDCKQYKEYGVKSTLLCVDITESTSCKVGSGKFLACKGDWV